MEQAEKLLDDWALLNNRLSKLSIDELKNLINYENSTRKRSSFLQRMHQRYSKLVTNDEREHVLSGGLL